MSKIGNGHQKLSFILCVQLNLGMKLLAVAFVWFLMQTCIEHQGGSSGLKMQYFSPFFSIKLEFCYLNISKNIQLFKNLFVSEQSITFRLHKTCVTFSWSPPWQQLGIIIEKGWDLLRQSWKYNMFDQFFFELVF